MWSLISLCLMFLRHTIGKMLVSTSSGYFKDNLRETCKVLRWCLAHISARKCPLLLGVILVWAVNAFFLGWSLFPGSVWILSFVLILLSSWICICISSCSATDVALLSTCCQSHEHSCKALSFAICRVVQSSFKTETFCLSVSFLLVMVHIFAMQGTLEVWLFKWDDVFQNSFVWKHLRMFLARFSWSVMLMKGCRECTVNAEASSLKVLFPLL